MLVVKVHITTMTRYSCRIQNFNSNNGFISGLNNKLLIVNYESVIMDNFFIIIGVFWILLAIVTYLMPLETKRKYLNWPIKRDYSEGHYKALSFIYILIGIMNVISGLFSFI